MKRNSDKERQTVFIFFFFMRDPVINSIIIYSHGLAVQAKILERI